MSSCAIVVFNDGKPVDEQEYRNAWGGAAYIWTVLFDRHLKRSEYDNWMMRSEDLWALPKRNDLPEFARAVLMSTFDYATIKRENFKRYAADLRQFVTTFGTGTGVCHIPAWADFIESLDAEAIGFHATSVSENLWFPWNESQEESIPYSLTDGDKHFEVYEECTLAVAG